ncbi:unnamed protein product [Ixodes pacificus]
MAPPRVLADYLHNLRQHGRVLRSMLLQGAVECCLGIKRFVYIYIYIYTNERNALKHFTEVSLGGASIVLKFDQCGLKKKTFKPEGTRYFLYVQEEKGQIPSTIISRDSPPKIESRSNENKEWANFRFKEQ